MGWNKKQINIHFGRVSCQVCNVFICVCAKLNILVILWVHIVTVYLLFSCGAVCRISINTWHGSFAAWGLLSVDVDSLGTRRSATVLTAFGSC